MMLATWDYAHPYSADAAWAGGNFAEKNCLAAEVFTDPTTSEKSLRFRVSDWVSNYVIGKQVDNGLVLISRTFYAGHSFNASLSGAGVLPVEQGSAVFYTNRTSSDQVAGFMQGMCHEMGRGMMRDALIESFEAIRARLNG